MRARLPLLLVIGINLTSCSILDMTSSDNPAIDGPFGFVGASERLARDLRVSGNFTIVSTEHGQRLAVSIDVTNLSQHDITGSTGPHPWWLLAYDDSTRAAAPVWEMQARYGAGPEPELPIRIPAGATVRFDQFPLLDLDPLLGNRGSGMVYFAAWLDLTQPDRDSPPLPAGSVYLSRED